MKRVLLGLLLTLALLTVAGAALLVDMRLQLQAPLAITQTQTVEIAPGSRLRDAVAELQSRRAFASARQPVYLEVWARVSGEAARIKAGEYAVEPGTSAMGLIALWVSGRTLLHEVRIVEGLRFNDAVRLIVDHPQVRRTLTDLDPGAIMRALGDGERHHEGRLFPDTYRFPRGTTDLDLLQQAHAAMRRTLEQAWTARAADLPYADAGQALVMASIVEKETGLADERERIAGVFVRRLRLGMRLQTDPTVIYGIGAGYDGNIRKRDLLTDTPYNTYTRDGLPPSPICLPGRAAIEAALNPADGTELFFVSRGDGSHEFTTTLAEHEAAVRRYQLGQGG